MTETVERWFEPSDGMAFVVRLLNTWDELEPNPELLRDASIAARFLRRHGFDDAAALADDAEVTALRNLRTGVRTAWDADDDQAAVDLLNPVLAASGVQPRLEAGDGGWVFRWDAP